MDTPQTGTIVPRFAIFTDFDGTLVELAETPDAITVPDDLGAEITAAARCVDGALAIVSGRALDDLERYLPAQIAVAGGHGSERRRADGTRVAPPPDLVAEAAAVADRLRPFADAHEALILETKASSVALHFRKAPELEVDSRIALLEALAAAPHLELLDGKMVVEARPAAAGKGEAVRAFMLEPPFVGRVPVFLGDDDTDEDGFRVAQSMGGVGIKIGEGQTTAKLRAPDVDTARAIIVGLARRVAETALTE